MTAQLWLMRPLLMPIQRSWIIPSLIAVEVSRNVHFVLWPNRAKLLQGRTGAFFFTSSFSPDMINAKPLQNDASTSAFKLPGWSHSCNWLKNVLEPRQKLPYYYSTYPIPNAASVSHWHMLMNSGLTELRVALNVSAMLLPNTKSFYEVNQAVS